MVVILCGMAVGAGFSTRENVSYIERVRGYVESTGNLLLAAGRLYAATLHIALTGTSAFFLAMSTFSKRKSFKVFKYLGWLWVVMAHGSFDGFLTFGRQMPLEKCYFRVRCEEVKVRGKMMPMCIISREGQLHLSSSS